MFIGEFKIGDKVRRKCWFEGEYIEITRDENVSDYTGKKEIRFMDGGLVEYQLTNDDILAKDWILFKRKGKRNEDC